MGQNVLVKLSSKYFATIIGGIISVIEPTLPIVSICVILILWDCFSAWELSRRVKKKFKANDGKFKSHHAGKVIVTILKSFLAIVLAAFIQQYITGEQFFISLPRMVAGAICAWQAWSILENESSCNDAKWAIVLQKIMVDKTERHFDIDLSDLREDIGDEYDEEHLKSKTDGRHK